MSGTELPPRFDPKSIERKWQDSWQRAGYFTAPDRPHTPSYTIMLPPPNITGVLTIGHMLGGTVQDLLVRHARMRGAPTLWLPGIDHSGLSTQVEVRKRLRKQGIRLDELPREEILRHIEGWKDEHEKRILEQMHAAGFSVDWSRYRYTLDPGFVRATRDAFLTLYRDGLIYRGERIVNWDPELKTAISDLEVLRTEESAELLYVRYPWAGGDPGGIVVATVRPETIFGDVAVAVHPEDERHRTHVGRSVRVPLTDRVVPVITDPGVDPKFGNGALKVTPRHDTLDFEIFRRHPDLPMPPSILSPSGALESDWVPERFRGVDRAKARAAVAGALKDEGFLERSETYVHAVGRSERTNAIVEPMLSTQWFVKLRELAPAVMDGVRRGEVRIHPDRWNLTFERWMENLEDWCISRQVAWGHPIPIHYCEACGTPVASADAPRQCAKCGGSRFRAETDVLDTWFSSWLWPFAPLGWPEETGDLRHYYPNSVLVTGRDIMFFWVARMLMAGYRFTGRAPFSHVFFTGMLRDDQGRKMSKHLGNSPDPLAVIDSWGADAMRFALLFPNPVDQDGPFGTSGLEGSRNFLTKLWNLVRFGLPHFPPGTEPPRAAPALRDESRLEDRWILSRWSSTAEAVDRAMEAFEFTQAAGLLHNFLWHDLADRYVEIAKESLQGKRGEIAARESRAVLLFVLERSLRQLAPIIPHVTEELWHALPHDGESLVVARWPSPSEARRDPGAELAMEVILEAIRSYRNLRADRKVPVTHLPRAFARPSGPEPLRVLEQEQATIVKIARLDGLTFLPPGSAPPEFSAGTVTPFGEFFIVLPPESRAAESDALGREREKLAQLLEKTRGRLADTGFRSRAPAEVVTEAERKVAELTDRIARLDAQLKGEGSSSPP